ncbi:MAG: NERD domain-containing protein [Frankiales bacterium]|nr:NERD domain-containing protein [Frankiales bacterium]
MSTGEFATARRRRALAADKRAGVFARSRARGLQYQFVRDHWRRLATLMVGAGGLGSVGLLLMPAGAIRVFFSGALVASVIAVAVFVVVLSTGTAATMMGDSAEQWTAQELRKLPDGWRLINHVMLRRAYDIDHVLVGPGGAFAVETKWSSHPWRLPGDERLRGAVNQARTNAADLTKWTEFRKATGTVTPLVVVWDTSTHSEVNECEFSGVSVVRGRHVKDWDWTLGPDVLTGEQVDRAWALLDQHVLRREARLNDIEAVPPSIFQLAARVWISFLVMLLTVLLVGYTIRLVDSTIWHAAVFVVFGAAAFVARRFPRIRVYAIASLAATALSGLALWGFVLYRVA